MLKLFRGCMKHHQLSHNGSPISWEFIKNLHEMQKTRNFNLGNKLTDMHLYFEAKPMNVRLAGQTINPAVADGIDQLRIDGYEEFRNSEKTTEVIRTVKNGFDVMNYKPNISGDGNNFKIPFNQCNAPRIFALFEEIRKLLKSIEIESVGKKNGQTYKKKNLAIKSKNFTSFFGFYHNCKSLEGLYEDYVVNGPLEELHTFQFSQDHLETWFSSVRSKCGRFRLIFDNHKY